MSQARDVIIIGGGVIGLTSAYYLARSGAAVAVIDKGELGAEASWAGAGIIAPGRFSQSLPPVDQLRALSVTQFPALSEELHLATGIDPGYRVCGGIEFFGPAEALVDAWTREGIGFERVVRGEITRLEPNCSQPAADCFFFQDMAQIRNPRYLQALIKACRTRDVQLRPQTAVTAINIDNQSMTGIQLESGERLTAGRFLLAAGAWTNQLLAPLQIDAGIHPVRGQIVLLKTNQPIVKRIILSGKKYIVPRDDGRTLIGATEEPSAGFVKETTAHGVQSLLDFGFSLVPKLKLAEIEKSWAGLRPGSIDGVPYLGAIPGFNNAFIASGHFRAGIQLSPGTALLMSEVILGKKPTIPLEFFRIGRKTDPAVIPAFRN